MRLDGAGHHEQPRCACRRRRCRRQHGAGRDQQRRTQRPRDDRLGWLGAPGWGGRGPWVAGSAGVAGAGAAAAGTTAGGAGASPAIAYPTTGGSGDATKATAPGITATTIYAGFYYSSDAAAGDRAIGAAGAAQSYDTRDMYRAVIDYANKHGGFAGRK